MKKRRKAQSHGRTKRSKKMKISFAGKLISAALFLFVVGTIAFFVYKNKIQGNSSEQRAMPHVRSAQHLLVLANGPDEVVIRS